MGAAVAIALGFPKERTDTLSLPKNTEKEAAMYAAKYVKRITCILVTDAVHMPRAEKYFRQQGIQLIPAPTNFVYK